MYTVDLYLRVRLACHVDGLSQREAASRFGIARETVRKMLRHSEPPGYRRRQPPKRPKLAPFTDIIDRILEEDRTVHRKHHHTAKRIFERLRDEHGFTGKETIVKDYVRERRLRRREMFVPLSHPPGPAQADFGEADAIIAGVKYRAHFFVMTLPHSDACFVAAYPAAATEAWLDGHNRAFVFFGGVPQSILYDNDKCLVSRILSDGTRQRTRAFSGLQSPYLFEDRYGRPGKGNDKGNVDPCRARWRHSSPRPPPPQRAEGLRLGLQQFHLHGQLSDPLHGAIQFRLHRIALALLERGVDPADRFLTPLLEPEDLYAQLARQKLHRLVTQKPQNDLTLARHRPSLAKSSGPAGKAWPGENVDEPSSPAFTTGPSKATFFSKLSVMFRSSLDTSIKPILCPRKSGPTQFGSKVEQVKTTMYKVDTRSVCGRFTLPNHIIGIGIVFIIPKAIILLQI